jgi:hypothetical protein
MTTQAAWRCPLREARSDDCPAVVHLLANTGSGEARMLFLLPHL